MRHLRLRASRAGANLLIGAALLAWSGCGGGELASQLSMRPRPKVLPATGQAVVHVPADEPFTIALAPSSETPGLGGTAEADSHADPAGSADAFARVKTSGKASAEFQLGCSLKNDTDHQVKMKVQAKCHYETELTLTPPQPAPGVQLVLRLYARDYNNRLVRKDHVFTATGENGGGATSGTVDLSFTHILGPGEAIDVFFAGAATIDIREGRSATCRIKLRDARMQVSTEAAPAMRP